MADITISRLNASGNNFREHVSLFARCFPKTSKLNADYLAWLYVQNPAGPVIAFDAYDSARLVAHYAVVPVVVEMDGQACRACWSLNTATDPAYQGRGLFVKLAEQTYEAAKAESCIGVIGVANQNSTHGFLKRLGFTLHGQLDLRNRCLRHPGRRRSG